tara:strand:+ start:2522 stop:2773 length:252 start_codon:yes stop_codon:yes gene_type:complete
MNRRKKREAPQKRHSMQDDSELALLYIELLKNEKYWRNSGQYYIARNYEMRAKSLLNGDIEGAKVPVKTEGFYCPTKKINFDH